jgi:hypothetical protein
MPGWLDRVEVWAQDRRLTLCLLRRSIWGLTGRLDTSAGWALIRWEVNSGYMRDIPDEKRECIPNFAPFSHLSENTNSIRKK